MPATERSEPIMSDAQVDKLVDIFLTALTGGDSRAELEAAVEGLSTDETVVLRRTLLDLDTGLRRVKGLLSEAQQ